MFKLNRKEKGQGLVEYALILVLIAIVVIGAMTLLGTKVSNTFGTVNAGLAGEGGGDDGEEAAAAEPEGAFTCDDPHAEWIQWFAVGYNPNTSSWEGYGGQSEAEVQGVVAHYSSSGLENARYFYCE